MPLARRLPKLKGFRPPQQTRYGVVNLDDLAELDADSIGPDELRAAGLVHKSDKLVKVLGGGSLDRKVSVSAHAFSATAKERIEAAGGSANLIDLTPTRKSGDST
jgi:large subunit ribosomal protein L15